MRLCFSFSVLSNTRTTSMLKPQGNLRGIGGNYRRKDVIAGPGDHFEVGCLQDDFFRFSLKFTRIDTLSL